MTGWVEPFDIGLKTPRVVEMTARAKISLAVALAVTLLFPMVFVPLASVEIQKREALERRGAPSYAQVTSLVVLYWRAGAAYRVEYEYEPKELGRIVGPRPRGVDILPIDAFPDLHSGQFIQIRYDPGDPDHAWVEGGFDQRRPIGASRDVYGAAALFGAAALAFLAFYASDFLEERRLLINGILTPAVIIAERDRFARFGRRSRATFQFTDAAGVVVRGALNGLPSASERSRRARAERRQTLDQPMALYDPRDSGRCLLCPPKLVQIR